MRKRTGKRPLVIGLTGSIGMGKSTAAKMMQELGAPVHSADVAVHKMLARNGAAVKQVAKVFPEVVHKQEVDRRLLGKEVFSSPGKLKKLEKILHPLVKKSELAFIKSSWQKGQRAVVLEIPLLFETGAEKRCDFVMCVTAPSKVQRARVLRRPGMTPAILRAILKKQLPDREKRRRADCVIQTGWGIADTRRRIKAMWLFLESFGKI